VLRINKKRVNGTSQRGSALMEYAMVLTVLFTMIFGIMDFSRAMFAYHWVSYAAREATRYASVHGSTYSTACPTTSPWVASSNEDCEITSSGTANVTNYVQSFAQGIYFDGTTTGNGGLTVTTTWPGSTGSPAGCNTANGTNSPGCPVKVVVTYIYGFSLPYVTGKVSSITMTSTSQVLVNQ
jgi:Flp pilus assembly protein TadG